MARKSGTRGEADRVNVREDVPTKWRVKMDFSASREGIEATNTVRTL